MLKFAVFYWYRFIVVLVKVHIQMAAALNVTLCCVWLSQEVFAAIINMMSCQTKPASNSKHIWLGVQDWALIQRRNATNSSSSSCGRMLGSNWLCSVWQRHGASAEASSCSNSSRMISCIIWSISSHWASLSLQQHRQLVTLLTHIMALYTQLSDQLRFILK